MELSNRKISVVIPSIGEKSLNKVITALNNGTIRPNEIIISIPIKYEKKVEQFKSIKNVIIITNYYASQVFQRSEGFKKAKYNFVMQLDSDIIVNKNTLEILIKHLIILGDDSSISPSMINKKNKINFLKQKLFKYFLQREKQLHIWDTWYDSDFYNEKDIYRVKWLPGGCIMHYKKNLLKYDFYPFKDSKSYDEDLLHSFLLYKNNIKLYLTKNTKTKNLDSLHYSYNSLVSLFKYTSRVFFIKNIIMKKNKGNSTYFFIWYITWFINEFFRFFKNKIKTKN